MKSVKQLRRLQLAYQKMRDIWFKSTDPNRYLVIYEFNITILEIEDEINFLKEVQNDSEVA
jgi:hypothetical protein